MGKPSKLSERYIVLPKSAVTEQQRTLLFNMLTIANPAYEYATRTIGISPSQVDLPRYFYLYEDSGIDLLLPRGFSDDVEVKLNLDFDDIKHEVTVPKFPVAKISSWKPDSRLRPYQVLPIQEIIDNNADILVASCGAGKTVCGVNLLARAKKPCIVVVNLDFLAKQWRSELLRFTNIPPAKIVDHKNGTKNYAGSEICIATIQSLNLMSYEEFSDFYDYFELAIFDEVHLMGSLIFCNTINKFKCKRIGLTATPERTDKFRSFLWSVGPRIVRTENPNDVKPIIIPFETLMTKFIDPKKYSMWTRVGNKPNAAKLINHLLSIESRNKLIYEIITKLLSMGRYLLVLNHRREYIEKMYESINCSSKCLLMGGTKLKDKVFTEQLVMATFQYVKQAFNYPRLDCILFTTPFAAVNDTVQSVGRILRYDENKPTPIVVDMIDIDTPSGTNGIGFCHAIARKRQRNYLNLNYPLAPKVYTVEDLETTIQGNR